MTIDDDVIREVRAAREAYCRQFDFNLNAITRDLQENQRRGGRNVVCLTPRKPQRSIQREIASTS